MKIDLKLPGGGHLKIEKEPMSEDTIFVIVPIAAMVFILLAFCILG